MIGFTGPLLLVLILGIAYALWNNGTFVRTAMSGVTSSMPTSLTGSQMLVIIAAVAVISIGMFASPVRVGAFSWFYWLPLLVIGAAFHALIELNTDAKLKDSKPILKKVVWSVVGIFLIGYPLLGWSRTVSLTSKVRCDPASAAQVRTCILTSAGSMPIATDSSAQTGMKFCFAPYDQITSVRYSGNETTFGLTPKYLSPGETLVVRYKAMRDCSQPMD